MAGAAEVRTALRGRSAYLVLAALSPLALFGLWFVVSAQGAAPAIILPSPGRRSR